MAKQFRFEWRSRPTRITVEDYREAARRVLPGMVWPYIDGGAEELLTLRDNREAFSRWRFLPKVLTGKDGTGLGATVCGQKLALPVFLAPTGMAGLAHWSGEPAAARAAERAGTRALISTAASYTPEEIAEATSEDHFFQLYPWADMASGAQEFSRSLIARARGAGYKALFVTVDVPVHGNRETDRRDGLGMPLRLTPRRLADLLVKHHWLRGYMRHKRISPRVMMELLQAGDVAEAAQRQLRVMRPELSWDDFRLMRDQWQGPLYIKGVLHPDDAETAVACGADGILVSNHGGRQLDGAQAAIDALVPIVERVGARVPVLLDGGVRRGTDVVKALCLGASAVAIGRPYLYGLAVEGEAGVARILEIFREEIARTLTLLGCGSIDELDRSMLVRA